MFVYSAKPADTANKRFAKIRVENLKIKSLKPAWCDGKISYVILAIFAST